MLASRNWRAIVHRPAPDQELLSPLSDLAPVTPSSQATPSLGSPRSNRRTVSIFPRVEKRRVCRQAFVPAIDFLSLLRLPTATFLEGYHALQ
jgi:hypothetical protein